MFCEYYFWHHPPVTHSLSHKIWKRISATGEFVCVLGGREIKVSLITLINVILRDVCAALSG